MAHFAKIENGIVTDVIVIANEQEHRGQDCINNDLNIPGTWIQTSYNNNIRGKFAGKGDTYDAEMDRFYSPAPYPSFILNKATGDWNAPIPYPDDNECYQWNEATLSWVECEQ